VLLELLQNRPLDDVQVVEVPHLQVPELIVKPLGLAQAL
jgi:hypothetical protein